MGGSKVKNQSVQDIAQDIHVCLVGLASVEVSRMISGPQSTLVDKLIAEIKLENTPTDIPCDSLPMFSKSWRESR